MEFGTLYEKLLELGLFIEEELLLLTTVNGASVETLNSAIYAKHGYQDLEQLMEEL